MSEEYPQTLAHIQILPLQAMSSDELLLSRNRFESSLQNCGMSMSQLKTHMTLLPMKMQSDALYSFLDSDMCKSIRQFDLVLVIRPFEFLACLKLIEIFHQLKQVEMFNQEVEYAHWLLTNVNGLDASTQARHLQDWESIHVMWRELNENNCDLIKQPVIGSAKVNRVNLVNFYAGIDEVIANCEPQKPMLEKNRLGENSSVNSEVEERVHYLGRRLGLVSDAEQNSINEAKESEQDNALVPDLTISVCDASKFQERQDRESESDNKRTLECMTSITQPKRLSRIHAQVFSEIKHIGLEQPNFAEVTELVLNTLHTQAISGRAAQLPPMLLAGPPGVGKTRYIKRIATALGLPFTDIQLAGVSDSFKISGLSRYWGTAGPGVVANIFSANDVANPIFLLDEIDKTKADDKGDPLSVILLLLENESSRCFKDLFVDVPLDVSHASFIATANDLGKLPEPLLSRFHCLEVKPLDYDGRCAMVKTTYSELLAQEKLHEFLESEIPMTTLDLLAGCNALAGRELKREILLAMQRACRGHEFGQKVRQKIALDETHLRLPAIVNKRSIGFMN